MARREVTRAVARDGTAMPSGVELDWGLDVRVTRVRAFHEFVRLLHTVDSILAGGAERDAMFACCEVRASAHLDGETGVGFGDRALADLRAARDAIAPFVATLDPEAMAMALRPDLRWDDIDAYATLDGTFVPGAPLAAAWRREPMLRRSAIAMARHDLDGLRAAVAGPSLRAALLARATNGMGATKARSVAKATSRAFIALDAAEGRDRDRMHGVPTGAWGFVDPIVHVSHMAACLPPPWIPRDAEGWSRFLDCLPAIECVQSWAGERGAAGLACGGDWTALGRRLAAAHGRGPGPMPLGKAIDDITDMRIACEEQVCAPALALAGRSPDPSASRALSNRLLQGGRGIARVLELSKRWHARRDAMAAAMPWDGRDPSWDPVLPDAVRHGVRMTVLRTRSDLVAEGSRTMDAEGHAGLDNCVGGYSVRCLSGECRVLSLRTIDGRRLSTAEVTWRAGTARVVQHRGLRNAAPSDEASLALDAYVADLRRLVLAASHPDLPILDDEYVEDRAGYDWRAPAAWKSVRDLWGFAFARPLRGASPETLARLLEDAP